MSRSTAPDSFVCPLSREVMDDPVQTVDGHTYERVWIEKWLQGHNTSPLTNVKLLDTKLTPNHALKKAIDEWSCMQVPTHSFRQVIDTGAKRASGTRMA
jgi:hypothetical protein